MTTEAYKGDTVPLVDSQGDGTHINLVKVVDGGGGGGGASDTTEATQLLVLSELQKLDTDVGQPSNPAAPADGAGNYSVISALKRVLLNGASMLARIPAALTRTANHDQAAQPMRLVPQNVWTAGYSQVGNVIDPVFNTPFVTPAGGVSFNQAAGALNVVSGVTANAEFLARSIESFRGSMRLRFSLIASQRIVNSNFAVLLADLIGENLAYTINSPTSVTVNVPNHGFPTAGAVNGQSIFLAAISGTTGSIPGRYAIASVPDANNLTFTVAGWPATGGGTLTLFGRNYVRNLVTGTNVNSLNVDAQRNGWATGDTVATINTTAAPGTLVQNELTGRDVFFEDTFRASVAVPSFATRASRYENIPDQTVDLFVFLWNFNGSTAPASTTTFTLGQTAVESFANNPVYVQGFRAQGFKNPLAVIFPSAQSVNVGAALPAGANLIGNTGGTAAHDAVISGNPNRIAGRALTAPYTAVASGDTADLVTTLQGSLVVQPFSIPEAKWDANVLLTATTDVVLAAAAGAGLKRHITSLWAINTGAADVELILRDGAAERKRYLLKVGVPTPVTFPGGGPTATANTACNAALSAANTGVRLNVEGYTGT